MRRVIVFVLAPALILILGACSDTKKTECVSGATGEVIPCPEENGTNPPSSPSPPDAGPTDTGGTTEPDSCKGICGDANNKGPCGCDLACLDWGDCCWDFSTACADYISNTSPNTDAGSSTPDAGSTDSGSTTPGYEFPDKFIPGELSQKDCQGIASRNMTWCETNQCKGIASSNYSWCDGHGDCKGIASANYTYCDSKDCRGIAEAYKCTETHKGDDTAIKNCRDQASNKHCNSKDCRGIALDDFSWCQTAACKAIVKKDMSWCSQL